MSYVITKISKRVRLLRWNHDPCLMDSDWLHLVPATLLWDRQRNPSRRLECEVNAISWPRVLHGIRLRSRPTSCRNSMATAWSVNKYVRKNLLGSPSSHNIRRPYDNCATWCFLRRRSSYSVTTWINRATIFFTKSCCHTGIACMKGRENAWNGGGGCCFIINAGMYVNGIVETRRTEFWKPEATSTAATRALVSVRLEPESCSVTHTPWNTLSSLSMNPKFPLGEIVFDSLFWRVAEGQKFESVVCDVKSDLR